MAAASSRRKPARIAAAPLVGVIMGSQSDWAVMRNAADVLATLQVPYEARIVSAHRTPERLYAYADSAQERGLKVIIAGAGGAAHLPGMTAAMTPLPVLGVPVSATGLQGFDSLLSIVQMPGGIPVGTLAIGRPGAINAAILAASILGLSDAKLMKRVEEYRKRQTAAVPLEPRDEPPAA
jgi:5-(carboxyamino)imidazole ribonucleotide mutase